MMARPRISPARLMSALLMAATFAACDASDPMGPELETPDEAAPSVVVGKISVSDPSLQSGQALASGNDLSGVVVTVEGANVSDTTDADGVFRVEVSSSDGNIVLLFSRGGMNAKLEIAGVGAGMILTVTVTLSNDNASLDDSTQGDRAEFGGMATLVSVSGDTPERTMRVEITNDAGTTLVDIAEGVTTFHKKSHPATFEELLAALDAGMILKIEGEGTLGNDASVAAVRIKSTDNQLHNDDDDDEHEFAGAATLVSVAGDAPERTLRVEVVRGDATLLVDILEGVTALHPNGDYLTFDDVLAALESDADIEMDGEGSLQDDGSIEAKKVKVKDAGDDDEEDDEYEFEGAATLVSVSGDAPERTLRVEITDDDETALVDILEGVTTLHPNGDYTTFDDVLAALESDASIEMDGEGSLQDDGSIEAKKVKVKDAGDDDDDDDDDEGNGQKKFEGVAALVSVTGDAPERTLRVEITRDAGTTLVDIVEGATKVMPNGDFTTFDAVLIALESDAVITMEGKGKLQDDESILAKKVTVEKRN